MPSTVKVLQNHSSTKTPVPATATNLVVHVVPTSDSPNLTQPLALANAHVIKVPAQTPLSPSSLPTNVLVIVIRLLILVQILLTLLSMLLHALATAHSPKVIALSTSQSLTQILVDVFATRIKLLAPTPLSPFSTQILVIANVKTMVLAPTQLCLISMPILALAVVM